MQSANSSDGQSWNQTETNSSTSALSDWLNTTSPSSLWNSTSTNQTEPSNSTVLSSVSSNSSAYTPDSASFNSSAYTPDNASSNLTANSSEHLNYTSSLPINQSALYKSPISEGHTSEILKQPGVIIGIVSTALGIVFVLASFIHCLRCRRNKLRKARSVRIISGFDFCDVNAIDGEHYNTFEHSEKLSAMGLKVPRPTFSKYPSSQRDSTASIYSTTSSVDTT
ncbi:hypothetical protein O181_013635 [Austropuccinia psidii MF-1]|uniref:Uncharacterized protein n=1 Tax=Austropuccinia psidii MF-1 TaxID=1389203 RepID=A0A9Q3GP44_9BASI|nr:hypothetical protein [Austropuccinia psidii MF-1]